MADAGLLTISLSWLEQHGRAYQLDSGQLCLEVPEPLVPIDIDQWDSVYTHRCRAGETLLSVAQQYYTNLGILDWPVGLWEVVFLGQAPGIEDPFSVLPEGMVLLIPPPDYIMEVASGDSLRDSPLQ